MYSMQSTFDNLDLETEVEKGLSITLFSYKPCNGGFIWIENDCNVNKQICDHVPFNQREPIQRTVKNYWTNNGMTTLDISAYMSRCPNGCSDRGRCNEDTGLCKCDHGFTGCDCSGK